jgi:hypothetical protein
MRRLLSATVVLAVFTAACTAQEPPARPALPEVPDELVPDFFVGSNAFDILSAAEGCAVLAGDGVRVLEVIDGSPAEGVLVPTDVIVAVDGIPTTTAEALSRVMRARGPGDVVTVGLEGEDGVEEIEIVLAQLGDDPAVGQMGVMTESRLTAHALAEVPRNFVDSSLARPIILDGELVVYDPLGAAWQRTEIPLPGARIAAVGGAGYLVVPEPVSAIVRVSDASVAVLDGIDWQLLWPVGSVGELLLVAASRTTQEGEATAVLAVDFDDQRVVWTWEPGPGADGNLIVPDAAYTSPSGELAVVSLISRTTEGDVVVRQALLDAEGHETADWGTESRSFIPDGVIVGGWYDETHIVYAAGTATAIVARIYDPVTGEDEVLSTLEADRVTSLWAVGDGRHLLVGTDLEITLVDAESAARRRPVFSGCEFGTIGNYGGLT